MSVYCSISNCVCKSVCKSLCKSCVTEDVCNLFGSFCTCSAVKRFYISLCLLQLLITGLCCLVHLYRICGYERVCLSVSWVWVECTLISWNALLLLASLGLSCSVLTREHFPILLGPNVAMLSISSPPNGPTKNFHISIREWSLNAIARIHNTAKSFFITWYVEFVCPVRLDR